MLDKILLSESENSDQVFDSFGSLIYVNHSTIASDCDRNPISFPNAFDGDVGSIWWI